MKLIQTTMQMYVSCVKKLPKIVLLWKEVGLCIHKGMYLGKAEKITYHVSHFNSGMSILRGIRTREQAIKYMQRVHDEVMNDWRFTLDDWNSEENNELRSELKPVVDAMQKEIYERG